MFSIHPLLRTKVIPRDCVASWIIMKQMTSWDQMGLFTMTLYSSPNHVSPVVLFFLSLELFSCHVAPSSLFYIMSKSQNRLKRNGRRGKTYLQDRIFNPLTFYYPRMITSNFSLYWQDIAKQTPTGGIRHCLDALLNSQNWRSYNRSSRNVINLHSILGWRGGLTVSVLDSSYESSGPGSNSQGASLLSIFVAD